MYLRARYYDPTTAQFLTRDPARAATHADYSYASDDPLDDSDPSGMCAQAVAASKRIPKCVAFTWPPCDMRFLRAKHSISSNSPRRASRRVYHALQDVFQYFGAPDPGPGANWEAEPARNKKGFILRQPGTTGDAETMRFMGATERYPNGYMKYYNKEGQAVNPATGKPGSKAETHIEPGYKGEMKNFPRWWTGK